MALREGPPGRAHKPRGTPGFQYAPKKPSHTGKVQRPTHAGAHHFYPTSTTDNKKHTQKWNIEQNARPRQAGESARYMNA